MLSIISTYRRSHIAAKALFDATGLNVLCPADTRWSYLSYVYTRLLSVHEELNTISEEHGWKQVKADDVKEIGQVLEFATSLHSFNDRLQGSKYPTISLVYPGFCHFRRLFRVPFKPRPNMIVQEDIL